MISGNVAIGNRGGLPIISTTAVVGTADIRISLPNHIFRFLGQKGKLIVELSAPIPTGTTATLPILIEVNGETRPLVNATGAGLTFTDIGTAIYFDILFDKVNNVVVLTSSLV